MANDLSADLAIRDDQQWWTPGQMIALKGTLGLGSASEAELAVFFHYCKNTQLDPFGRQIYYLKRRVKVDGQFQDRWTIQVGIDGFRVIRDRAARRDHVDVEYEDTLWYDATGEATDVWLLDTPPTACKVVVLKGGRRFSGVVRFDAYAQTYKPRASKDEPDPEPRLTDMWVRMGDGQLEKCAEAKALRRAFPHDLSGIYVEEELQHEAHEGQSQAKRPSSHNRPRLRPEDPEGHETAAPDAYSEPRAPHNRTEALEQIQALFKRAGFGEEDRALRLFLTGQMAAQEGSPPLEITTTAALGEGDAMEVCRTFKLIMRKAHKDDQPLRMALEAVAMSCGWTEAGPSPEEG